jgi:predicted transcriptional regulator
MKILLSIKPEYSNRIFSGEKKFEFRRQRPKHRLEAVYVYESRPTKKIVGWFSVKNVICGSPNDIWNRCGKIGGIEKEDYFKYCGNQKVIYAFEIDMAIRFDSPIELSELDPTFTPPQSYVYLSHQQEQIIKRRKIKDENIISMEEIKYNGSMDPQIYSQLSH